MHEAHQPTGVKQFANDLYFFYEYASSNSRCAAPYRKLPLGRCSSSRFVFVTDGLLELRVRQQTHVLPEGPWSGICVGVVDRDLNIHVAEILPVEPLDDVQRFGYRRRKVRRLPIIGVVGPPDS